MISGWKFSGKIRLLVGVVECIGLCVIRYVYVVVMLLFDICVK